MLPDGDQPVERRELIVSAAIAWLNDRMLAG